MHVAFFFVCFKLLMSDLPWNWRLAVLLLIGPNRMNKTGEKYSWKANKKKTRENAHWIITAWLPACLDKAWRRELVSCILPLKSFCTAPKKFPVSNPFSLSFCAKADTFLLRPRQTKCKKLSAFLHNPIKSLALLSRLVFCVDLISTSIQD